MKPSRSYRSSRVAACRRCAWGQSKGRSCVPPLRLTAVRLDVVWFAATIILQHSACLARLEWASRGITAFTEVRAENNFAANDNSSLGKRQTPLGREKKKKKRRSQCKRVFQPQRKNDYKTYRRGCGRGGAESACQLQRRRIVPPEAAILGFDPVWLSAVVVLHDSPNISWLQGASRSIGKFTEVGAQDDFAAN